MFAFGQKSCVLTRGAGIQNIAINDCVLIG